MQLFVLSNFAWIILGDNYGVWLFLAWAGNMDVVGTTRRGEIGSILDGECEDKGKVQKNQKEDGIGINMNEIKFVLNFVLIRE